MLAIAYQWHWLDHLFLYMEEYCITQLRSSDPHLLAREEKREE